MVKCLVRQTFYKISFHLLGAAQQGTQGKKTPLYTVHTLICDVKGCLSWFVFPFVCLQNAHVTGRAQTWLNAHWAAPVYVMRWPGSAHAVVVQQEFGVIIVRMDTGIWMERLDVSLVTVTQATLSVICVTRWPSLDVLVLFFKYPQMYEDIFTFFLCIQVTGQCPCETGYGGKQCKECAANHFGNPDIQCICMWLNIRDTTLVSF